MAQRPHPVLQDENLLEAIFQHLPLNNRGSLPHVSSVWRRVARRFAEQLRLEDKVLLCLYERRRPCHLDELAASLHLPHGLVRRAVLRLYDQGALHESEPGWMYHPTGRAGALGHWDYGVFGNEDHCNAEYDSRELTFRGKWIFEDADSIEDMIEALQQKTKELAQLKAEGWRVQVAREDHFVLKPPRS